ncbi:MAG: hypothetical protein HUU25_01530 [Candidatus Sumerlaeia bacterium]|nr:hypothetical protein [Candidatus Sumerlaeia bacterium]
MSRLSLLTAALWAGAAGGPAGTVDVGEYFPLLPNSRWSYTGEGQPGSSAEDDFSWIVLDDLRDIGGTFVTQILTSSEEPTDARNLDRDFWSYSGAGELRYHGFRNGQADGSGLTTFPVQDVILDTPFVVGTATTTIPSTISSTATASDVSFGLFSGLTATLSLEAEFVEITPVVVTPAGDFRDCLHVILRFTVTEVTNGTLTFPVGVGVLQAELFLAPGVGMVLQDQDADPGDAQIQALEGGQVLGFPIVADVPSVQQIVNRLLGLLPDDPRYNVNADDRTDAADVVDRVGPLAP